MEGRINILKLRERTKKLKKEDITIKESSKYFFTLFETYPSIFNLVEFMLGLICCLRENYGNCRFKRQKNFVRIRS